MAQSQGLASSTDRFWHRNCSYTGIPHLLKFSAVSRLDKYGCGPCPEPSTLQGFRRTMRRFGQADKEVVHVPPCLDYHHPPHHFLDGLRADPHPPARPDTVSARLPAAR